LKVAETALKIFELAEQVVSVGNLNAISDGGTAAALAHAAIKGAGLNVRINAASLKDQSQAQSFIDQIMVIEDSADGIAVKVWETISERGKL
jgi:formiminotetrahydrofolate cyclodeaminase